MNNICKTSENLEDDSLLQKITDATENIHKLKVIKAPREDVQNAINILTELKLKKCIKKYGLISKNNGAVSLKLSSFLYTEINASS